MKYNSPKWHDPWNSDPAPCITLCFYLLSESVTTNWLFQLWGRCGPGRHRGSSGAGRCGGDDSELWADPGTAGAGHGAPHQADGQEGGGARPEGGGESPGLSASVRATDHHICSGWLVLIYLNGMIACNLYPCRPLNYVWQIIIILLFNIC